MTSTFGVQSGYVNESAAAIRQGSKAKEGGLQSVYFFLCLFGSLVTATAIFVFSSPINNWLFPGADYIFYIRLVALNSLLLGPVLFFPSMLQANLLIRKLMVYSIALSIISTLVTILLLYFYQLDGVVFSFVLNSGFAILLGIWFVRNVRHPWYHTLRINIFRQLPLLRQLLKYGAAGLLTSVAFQIGYTIIKSILIKQGDLSDAGMYQSVANISNQYLPVFLTSLSTYVIPLMAGANRKEQGVSVNNSMRAVSILSFPVIVVLALFGNEILVVLYSSEFSSAAPLLIWMVLADLIKVINRVMGSLVIVLKNFRLWITTDLLSIVSSILLTYLLFPVYGLKGVAFAMIATQIMIFLIYTLSLKRISGFQISRQMYFFLAGAISLLLVINLVPVPLYIKTIISFTGLFALVGSLLKRNEWLRIKNFIRNDSNREY